MHSIVFIKNYCYQCVYLYQLLFLYLRFTESSIFIHSVLVRQLLWFSYKLQFTSFHKLIVNEYSRMGFYPLKSKSLYSHLILSRNIQLCNILNNLLFYIALLGFDSVYHTMEMPQQRQHKTMVIFKYMSTLGWLSELKRNIILIFNLKMKSLNDSIFKFDQFPIVILVNLIDMARGVQQ